MEKFDVIVVGGGMVGATAACALAFGGIRVALLDRREPPRQWPEDSVDLRVSALTRASQNILESIGVWPLMVERGVCPYRDMRVWDAKADGELHFDCGATEYDELGHIVENRVTVASLWDVLATLGDATCVSDAVVAEMSLQEQGGQILLQDGRRFEADLIVAADGRESFLRDQAGISVTGWPYHQDGLVATVNTEKSHQATAWQRFLDEGPLAFLPLANGQCSIVWTLKTTTAQAYLHLPEDEFLHQLELASAGILGRMLATGPRAAFPLKFQYADRYTDRHFALIGDAAHAMHPLAGQGANAGLLDAAALAEVVIKSKRECRPLAGHQCLRRYERWRKGDNLLMMASMDALNKIFAAQALPLVSLRSAGMNWIDHASFIKNYFNNHAMGLRDDLPLLARKQVCW